MLDDFREQAGSFVEDEQPQSSPTVERIRRTRIMGMTPFQTCIVAVLLFGISCLLSMFCLLVTGRVVPPFLY